MGKSSYNITLSVGGDLGRKMEKHPDIKWSRVAARAIEGKLKEIEFEKQILSKSKFTLKDADNLGRKIKKEIAKELNLK